MSKKSKQIEEPVAYLICKVTDQTYYGDIINPLYITKNLTNAEKENWNDDFTYIYGIYQDGRLKFLNTIGSSCED